MARPRISDLFLCCQTIIHFLTLEVTYFFLILYNIKRISQQIRIGLIIHNLKISTPTGKTLVEKDKRNNGALEKFNDQKCIANREIKHPSCQSMHAVTLDCLYNRNMFP